MIGTGKFWIGVFISALLLVLFLMTVDLGRMYDALADAHYLFIVPGLGLYLISVLFRTLRWQVLLRHLRPIPLRRLYPVVVVGYMANNLLPMRLGELVRSYYVGEREGISKTSALSTIIVERVLDALVLLFFIAGVALFVPLTGLAEELADALPDWLPIPWPLLVVFFSVPFVFAFAALLLFAFYPTRTRQRAMALIGTLPGRFEAPLRHFVDMLLDGLIPLRNPRTLALLFLLSVPIWLFEAGLFFFVGFSFDLDGVYDNLGDLAVASMLVTSLANIGSSIPGPPGGIGAFEWVARETLVFLPIASVDRDVATGFAAVVHFVLLGSMIVLGQVFLWAGHISLRRLSEAERRERAHRPETGQVDSSLAPTTLSVECEEPQ